MYRVLSGVVTIAVLLGVCIDAGAATAQKLPSQLVFKEGIKFVKPAGTKALTPASKVTLPFTDYCEGTFPGNWAPFNNPYFGPTTYKKFAGNKSYYCAQSGTGAVAAPGPYPTNFTGWITYGPFSLAGVSSGKVTFKLWNISEANYDQVFAGWSLDDSDYEGAVWSGNSNGWITATCNMKNAGYDQTYVGKSTVYFSFYFSSDSSNVYEGAYLDNISITTGATTQTGSVTGTIKNGKGVVMKGVYVAAGSKFVWTDAQGKYTIPLAAGTYTVKPTKPGYKFTPASTSVTIAGSAVTKDFTGTQRKGDGVKKYWAVSVGIANFASINDLNYCDDDARDVTAALKAGGYPAANIKQLIDSQATKAAIRSAITWMCNKADADDTCVFFQSSHGNQGADLDPQDEAANNDEYLCPYDTTAALTSQIRDDELGWWLSALKTRRYVVLIDACYAGGLIKSTGAGFGGGFARAINGMTEPGELVTKDVDDLGAGVVVTSCTDTELSEESGSLQNGVFAYYLVQGMNNGKADANKNGWYSGEEVFNYSKGRAHTYNPDQTLVMYDGFTGQLDFAQKYTASAAPSALSISGAAAATKVGGSAITVTLSAPANVTGNILNLAGRSIATFAGQDLEKGVSTLLWSGKSNQGTLVPPGQYFVKLQARDTYGNCANCLLTLRK